MLSGREDCPLQGRRRRDIRQMPPLPCGRCRRRRCSTASKRDPSPSACDPGCFTDECLKEKLKNSCSRNLAQQQQSDQRQSMERQAVEAQRGGRARKKMQMGAGHGARPASAAVIQSDAPSWLTCRAGGRRPGPCLAGRPCGSKGSESIREPCAQPSRMWQPMQLQGSRPGTHR